MLGNHGKTNSYFRQNRVKSLWKGLLGEGSESQVYSYYDFQRVMEPVLLMTDVAYARAGNTETDRADGANRGV